MRRSIWALGAFFAAGLLCNSVEAANFSCSFGRGACLDYGDTVCSSGGKCVERNAVCFNSYTCDFQGFVCKSAMDDLSDAYDELLTKAKRLSTDFSSLADDNRDLVDKYNDLLSEHEALANNHRSARDCVADAASLEDAQACRY